MPLRFALLLVLLIGQAHAGTLLGRVVGVADGDTITVIDAAHRQHKIRIAGIDAPERSQAFGRVAKEPMSDLVFNKEVRVDTRKADRYGRTIGVVWAPVACKAASCPTPLDVGQRMLKKGLAWHYTQYAKDQPSAERRRYAAAESAARAQELGLWRDSTAIAPWNWRKKDM